MKIRSFTATLLIVLLACSFSFGFGPAASANYSGVGVRGTSPTSQVMLAWVSGRDGTTQLADGEILKRGQRKVERPKGADLASNEEHLSAIAKISDIVKRSQGAGMSSNLSMGANKDTPKFAIVSFGDSFRSRQVLGISTAPLPPGSKFFGFKITTSGGIDFNWTWSLSEKINPGLWYEIERSEQGTYNRPSGNALYGIVYEDPKGDQFVYWTEKNYMNFGAEPVRQVVLDGYAEDSNGNPKISLFGQFGSAAAVQLYIPEADYMFQPVRNKELKLRSNGMTIDLSRCDCYTPGGDIHATTVADDGYSDTFVVRYVKGNSGIPLAGSEPGAIPPRPKIQ